MESSVGGPSRSFSVNRLLHAFRTQVKAKWSDLNKSGSLVMSTRDLTAEPMLPLRRH